MPLFKVLLLNSTNDEKRVLVSASTLEELKRKSVSALPSPPPTAAASYCVYDESDSSLIADDDCLMALAEFCTAKGVHLSLRLLPAGVSTGTCFPSMPSTPNTVRPVSPPSIASNPSAGFPPLRKFILDLKEACQVPLHRRNQGLTRARSKVVKEIVDKVDKLPLKPGAIMDYCKRLYSGCPEAFKVNIKQDTESCTFPQFVRSVYNALNYAKSFNQDRPKPRNRRRLVSDDDPDDVEPVVPLLCVDENGCQEGMWGPAIPDCDRDVLTDKQKQLSGYAALPTCDDDDTTKDMFRATYPLQRDSINRAKTVSSWNAIFASWPLFRNKVYLLIHGDLLLGKDTTKVWYQEASTHPLIISFMESRINSHQQSSRSSLFMSMSTIIDCMYSAKESSSSNRPISIAVFPLLILYFKEKLDSFYLLFERSTPLAEAVEAAAEKSECPIIIVRGSSIFDPTAKTTVLVRKQLVIETSDFIESMLVMFISYYVFNINYPKTMCRTLEFFQRFFLRINPEVQSRCEGSRKVKINSQVRKLATALTDFELLKSRWSA